METVSLMDGQYCFLLIIHCLHVELSLIPLDTFLHNSEIQAGDIFALSKTMEFFNTL